MTESPLEAKLKGEIVRLRQDLQDALVFLTRCRGCGRLHMPGRLCPDGTHEGCPE